jgi:hypothetical protein
MIAMMKPITGSQNKATPRIPRTMPAVAGPFEGGAEVRSGGTNFVGTGGGEGRTPDGI